ncbi:MAG: hypothetical protein FJ146_01960 [Deltaproteobacteria bacterium]|nr:hypothetical protein [Deltaproteobacteria bacterium]
MQLSARIKAKASEVIRFAKQLLVPFEIDDLARQILIKDIARLRQRFHGQIPKSLTATDVAAHLELHDASMRLISDHCVTEGFHILKGADFFQVVKTEHGRRHNIAVVKHIHAALIIYCEHLLADLRGDVAGLRAAPVAGAAPMIIHSAPNSVSTRARPSTTAAPRRHLHLVH